MAKSILTPFTFSAGGNAINNDAAATVPLTIKGAASQTANLQEWQTSTPTTVASISSAGAFTAASITSGTEITVGATFAGNAGFEIGRTNGASSTPFIDFHSGATATDFDSRIIASGGNGTNGQGTLTYTAATNTFTGTLSATSVTSTGDITAGNNLRSSFSSGDEGGQIFLNKPVTGTAITSGVNIDIYQNKLRFWEDGGSNRGYFIDITSGANSVGTQLVGVGTTSNSLIIKGDSGTTEGTNQYTFNGSAAKTLNFVSGTNLTIAETSGTFTFNVADASASVAGAVTTGTQTLAGAKILVNPLTINAQPGQYDSSLIITESTFATGKRASINLGNNAASWIIGQDLGGTGTRDFLIYGNGGDRLRISTAGLVTASAFSGSGASLTSIPNSALVNSSITIGSTTISLGGTAPTNLAGVTINGTTIPSSVTLARRDAAQTFTGIQTMTSPAVFTSITTTSSTFDLINSGAGTINFGGAASVMNIGGTSPGNFVDVGYDLVVSNALTVTEGASFGGGFGSAGATISTAGNIDTNGTLNAEGSLTVGTAAINSSITRAYLAGGGTTGATFSNTGALVRTASSARYKQDIADANYSYEDVLALSPKTFRLKEEAESNPDSKVYGGLIAEEVHELESLRVFVNYKTEEDGSVIPDGIAYGEMVSALVSALKHQDARIQALEAQVQALSE